MIDNIEAYVKAHCMRYSIPVDEDMLSEGMLANLAFNGDEREVTNALNRYAYREKKYNDTQLNHDYLLD
jgi:hypothetical protein